MLKFAISICILLSATAWGDEKKPEETNPRLEKLFRSMRDGTYDQFQGNKWFPDLRWDDIPALLKRGDSKDHPKRFPINPASSQAEQAPPTEGAIALWLIEGIRKGGKLPSLNILLASEAKIERSDAAQKKVLEAYQRWWKKVEKMPVEEARKVEPLAGTGLAWH